MIRKCDCNTKREAKAWCYIHGYLNKIQPSPSPVKKPVQKKAK